MKVGEIKELSSVKEEPNTIEIKAMYDRLKQISKEEWKRIIDIGEQTKSFEYKELQNVKRVSFKLLKKEKIKETSISKCYESLTKLKKFNIINI